MPTYDYKCTKCNKTFEVFQSITAEPKATCPDTNCGAQAERIMSKGSGFVLKGTGYYQTDFKNKAPAATCGSSEKCSTCPASAGS